MHGHAGNHMQWNDTASWWMVTMTILFAVALIAVVVWAVVATTRNGRAARPPSAHVPPGTQLSSGRAILDERFARGEIDAAEYEERRQLLDGGQGRTS